jgi:hypothetical protein
MSAAPRPPAPPLPVDFDAPVSPDFVVLAGALAVMFDRVTRDEAGAAGLTDHLVYAIVSAGADVGARMVREVLTRYPVGVTDAPSA